MEDLNIVMKASDILKKGDFVQAFKVLTDHIKKIDARNVEDFKQVHRFLTTLADQVKADHDRLTKELKGQVNEVFVGDQMKRMKGDMQMTAEEMRTMMSEHMAGMEKRMEAKMATLKDGEKGEQGPMGLSGSPDTPTKIKAKLLALKGTDRITKDAIAGLEDYDKKFDAVNQRISGINFGALKRHILKVDLSSQCTGATNTFTVPNNFGVIGLYSSQSPNAFRPTIDYTEGRGTIVLDSNIPYIQPGQTLIAQILK